MFERFFAKVWFSLSFIERVKKTNEILFFFRQRNSNTHSKVLNIIKIKTKKIFINKYHLLSIYFFLIIRFRKEIKQSPLYMQKNDT